MVGAVCRDDLIQQRLNLWLRDLPETWKLQIRVTSEYLRLPRVQDSMVLAQYNISYRGHGTKIRHRRLMTELESHVTNHLKFDCTMVTKSCAKASNVLRTVS